jgi:hypothetical protein
MKHATFASTAASALVLLAASAASAQQAPAQEGPKGWWGGVKISGHLEAGYTFNTDQPDDGINFGHSFTDRSDRPVMNQLGATIERPIDAAAESIDLGFKFQAIYGTDARYTHTLGIFDRAIDSLYQVDIFEANAQAHLPWGPAGVSTDVKLGIYPTPLGLEVLDPRGNFFYSKSYIFSWGLPFKHTGLLTTTHVTPVIDLWAGVDTGVNTSIGHSGDNNGVAAAIGGFGLNLLGGKLALLALTHIGPENPRGSAPPVDPDGDLRYYNDILVTWKVSDSLTSNTELNYVRDDGFKAEGYGAAQYLIYAINDQVSIGGRGEVWRDDDGFFVARFPGRKDVANLLAGRALEDARSGTTGGATTYGALTFGVNWKPSLGWPAIESFMLRPELRYDRSLDGARPYDGGTSRDQFTLGMDVVLTF